MKWLLFCSLNNEYVENDNGGKKKEILMSTMTMMATKENLLAVGNEGVLVGLVKRSWQCLALNMVL